MSETHTHILNAEKNGESINLKYAITTYMEKGRQIIDVEIKRFLRNGVDVSKGNTLREQFTL